MPTTYIPADKKVHEMARGILREFETHAPVINAGVKVDLVMAHAPTDPDTGAVLGCALKKNGRQALGICRVVNLKDRSKGMGDAEICLDANWWADASEEDQRGLLDHELHHIAVVVNQKGVVAKDDLDRPKLKMRKHDIEFGWFTLIAARQGVHSQERQQAKRILEKSGQFYWPELLAGDKAEQLARKIRNHETVPA